MSIVLFWLMLASLVSVGIVSPAWREFPLAAVALTSGLLMYVDESTDMPLWVRTALWLAVSLAYTAAQWQLRVGEEGAGIAEPSDLFAPAIRPARDDDASPAEAVELRREVAPSAVNAT